MASWIFIAAVVQSAKGVSAFVPLPSTNNVFAEISNAKSNEAHVAIHTVNLLKTRMVGWLLAPEVYKASPSDVE
jgi:hypothetical protein